MEEEAAPLRVLLVEDEPDDAALVLKELSSAGYRLSTRRVETEESFLEALESPPDVILADFTLPRFNALRALRLLQARELDIPFVVVTGTTGEDRAVECMREGADDYLVKDRLARLGHAVERALSEKRLQDEKRRVEYELRTSEIWSRKIFESALDAIIVVDDRGRILDWNPRAEATFGWARHEALGCSLVETLLPPRLRGDHPEGIGSLLSGGPDSIDHERLETSALTREGKEITVEVTISPMQVGDGWILGIFARDLSERKQAEERRRQLEAQLFQAQRMEAIALLASGVAHDFNNILTVITGQCHLMLSNDELEPERRRIEEISHAADRAAALTRQLLAFSRRQVLQPTVLDLNDVLDEMNSMLSRVIGEDIVIRTEKSAEQGRVRADRGQIEQVVMNLAVNARDAMPRGGKLTLRTENLRLDEKASEARKGLPPGTYVMLRVIDLGDGMDKEVLARIFEPFYTTKELGRGTGLGLSTVYGIVKQSNGYIYVNSEPGRGSTFEVLLPQVEEPLSPVPEPPPLSPRGEGRIMLVEDDDGVRKLTREVLVRHGFTVLESVGGREALARIEKERGELDLVVTDLVMPGMGGDEFAELLSARFPRIKVLYTSGHLDRPTPLPLTPGYRELMRKPFKSAELVRKVVELAGPEAPLDPYEPEPRGRA